MKTLLILLFPFLAHAQYEYWSPATPVSFDSSDVTNPALPDSRFWGGWGEEWLACTRQRQDGSDIIVLQTDSAGARWITKAGQITNDTTSDDHATVAHIAVYNRPLRRMILWQRGRNEIYYAYSPDSSWLPPTPLGAGTFGGRTPCVTAADTTFAAVWENGGRLVFSEFKSNAWSPPAFISGPDDTVNFAPQVKYIDGGNPYRPRPMLVWERRKRASRERSITFSVRVDTGWTVPDTLVAAGNNRNPRFVKLLTYACMLSYESNREGHSQIYGAMGYNNTSGISWSSRATPLSLTGENTNASFMLIPIITNSPNSPTLFYVTGGTWRRTNASGQDSIVVSLGNSPYYYEQRSGGAGEDINPVISGGVLTGDWRWRFWSVWESYVAGRWRLFGSWVKVSIGDVKEGGVVNAFQLEQNYPNPFNPTTTIRFTIPVGTGHAPSLLKVYDVLGREVTTLVNEAKEPGDHQITFNAEGLSSGVYLYKLQVGNFVAVRKLIVLR